MTSPAMAAGNVEGARSLGWLGWAIPLGVCLLWFCEQPAPHPDDLFFSGAAISLARGDGLTNPWLANWLHEQFQTSCFYVQTPYHTWLQSAWLRVAGVSGAAFRGFALAWSAVAALAVADGLRRAGTSRGWAAGGAAICVIFLMGHGFRADSLGAGLIGAGHLLLARNRPWLQWPGLFLCGLGAAAHPFALCLAVPVVLGHARLGWIAAPADRRARWLAMAGLAATSGAAAVILMGLLLIDGDAGEFLRIFRQHRDLALPGAHQRWEFFTAQFLLGYEAWRRLPFVVIGIALLVLHASTGSNRTPAAFFLAGFALFIAIGYVLYAQYLARYLTYVVFAALPMLTVEARGWRRQTMALSGAGIMLLGPSTDVLAVAARTVPPSRAQTRTLREEVQRSSQAHLVLDEFTVRHLYDFRPPPHTRDWQVGRPAGGRPLGFNVADKPADELWVVSAHKLSHAVRGASVSPIYLEFAGRPLRSIELGVELAILP